VYNYFMKQYALLLVGIIMTLLGSLWFLQGTGIVHLNPILCVAECEPMTGTSPLWATIGAIVSVGGILLIVKGLKSFRA
jgi:hypothetical protein